MSTFGGRVSTVRLPATNSWMGRSQAGTRSQDMGVGSFSRQGDFGNRNEAGMGRRSFGGFHGSGITGNSGFSGGGSIGFSGGNRGFSRGGSRGH